MDVVVARGAGMDVQKTTVVGCRLTLGTRGQRTAETPTFGTTTAELLRLDDGLTAGGCTPIGLESTGEDGRPVHTSVQGSFAVGLLNAPHITAVPGRQTDVQHAPWIAELLRHGLVRPSFIAPRAPRERRQLTRHRTNCVRVRASLLHRLHKVRASARISSGPGWLPL